MRPVEPPNDALARPSDYFRVAGRARASSPASAFDVLVDAAGQGLDAEEVTRGSGLATRLESSFVAQRAGTDLPRTRGGGAAEGSSAARNAEARTRELLAGQVRMSQRCSALMAAARQLAGCTASEEICQLGADLAENQLDGAVAFVAQTDTASNAFRLRTLGARARQPSPNAGRGVEKCRWRATRLRADPL
jgi:hypothetical protein